MIAITSLIINSISELKDKKVSIYQREGCDKRSIFKRSITGLNLELSFSKTGYHTNISLSNNFAEGI